MLIRQWLNPSDFPSNDRFIEAYNEALAEVRVSERFLKQFDKDNIEAQIRNINQQLTRMGEDAR